MSLLEALFLAVVQGVAEFLPISSSGHLAILKNVFGVNTDTGLLYDVMLHVGTLAAVFIVYWKDIWELRQRSGNMVHMFRKAMEKTGNMRVLLPDS